MIHTNELMLGNWVEYATGLHGDKRSIPMQVTGIFSDTVYLNFDGNEGDVFEEEEENLLGIPITEELLEKCGFNMKKWIDENNVIVDKFPNGYALLMYSRRIEGISFLHELQNAYFMTAKKHLEVKL